MLFSARPPPLRRNRLPFISCFDIVKSMLMRTKADTHSSEEADAEIEEEKKAERDGVDLVPLFRLLARQPPKDHDFRMCPICKRHGIAEI